MTTPYDSSKAKLANTLLQQGIPLAEALAQAGIDSADAGNYGIYEGRVVAADFDTEQIPYDPAPDTGYSQAQTQAVPIADIQIRPIESNTSGGYPARPNTYVPPTGVDRFPATPTQDDEINQTIAAQRARLGVSSSSIVQAPPAQPDSGATGATALASYSSPPTPDTNSLGITSQAAVVTPFQQGVPQEDPYAAGNTNALGITSEANVTSLRRDVPVESFADPYATGTNPLGVTAQSNIEGNPFQQGVPQDDPLAAQADEIGTTNALGVTGEARVGPFAQINPYANDPVSTDPGINTGPDAVDAARSGLPQPRENFGTYTNEDAQTSELANDYSQTENARNQETIRSQRSGYNSKDWRVRIALAPQATYLYKSAFTGDLLYPLRWTDGVIFPYTPTIQTSYRANYETYDLTHSNIRGLFYKSSSPMDINITGTFTAQDTSEANYLLAVMHFFKSCTKMFYGQDAEAGTPPPLVYLSGYGEYQFAEHPCVITSFNYTLPADVDYIRARSVSINGTNLVTRRDRQTNVPSTSPIYSAISRLRTIFIPKGANPQAAATATYDTSGNSTELGGNTPTYVPTQMEIQLTLMPIQSRSQMSKQFSLREFAQGKLLKGGFW